MKVRTSGMRGFALMALSALAFTACESKTETPPPPPPEVTVAVVPQSASLQVGQTQDFAAIVGNASNTAVTWSSSNSSVASVSANGRVTAVAEGTALITATSVQDPTKVGAASVVVTAAPLPTLTLLPSSATISIGGTVQMTSIVTGTSNTDVTYSSTNEAVATVSASGLVTGVSAGSATIIARSAANTSVVAQSVITVVPGQTEPDVTITITPTTASAQVGATQTFVATVGNTTNTTVNWTSSDEAVATVNSNGVATAVGPGTAVITATSAADPTKSVTATFTVTAAPPVTQPAISIQSVVDSAGNALTPGSTVTGVVRVNMSVAAGSEAHVTEVRVLLDDIVTVCQTFSPPLTSTQGSQSITCSINTRAAPNGTVRFPNDVYTLIAEALTTTGSPARATWGDLVFANMTHVSLTVDTDPVSSANGSTFAAGFEWHEGDVVVTAQPVIFQSGSTLASMQICLEVPAASAAPGSQTGTSCKAGTAQSNGTFVATFPKSRSVGAGGSAGPGVNDVSNSAVEAYVSGTVTNTGAAGPMTNRPGVTFRLDNLEPDAPTTVDWTGGEWIGADFSFNRANTTTHSSAALENLDPDPGVGGVSLTFHVFTGSETQYNNLGNSTGARNQAVVNSGQQVTSSNELGTTDTDEAYILVVRAVDALGNQVLTRVPGAFGVDVVAPEFNFTENRITGSPANMTINPVTDFQFEFPFVAGNVSGTILNPEVMITRYYYDFGATTVTARTQCVYVDGTAPHARTSNNPCEWHSAPGNTVAVPADEGYYEMSFRFRDNADNLSDVQSRTVLRDTNGPDVVMSSSFALAGSVLSMGARIRDNVDIRSWDTRLRFGAAPAPTGAASNVLPVAPETVIGSFGPSNRVGLHDVTASVTMWRSLMVTNQADGNLATMHNTDGAGFGAFDIAQNYGQDFMAVTQTGGAVPAGLDNVNISLSGTTFCNGTTPPSGDQGRLCVTSGSNPDPQTRTVTFTASGPTGFVTPFTNVHVYRVDLRGNVRYLGQASFVASGSVGTRFEHRWAFTANAAAFRGEADVANGATADGAGTAQIFGVGVTSNRDAFRSPTVAVSVRGAHRQPR